MESFRQKVILWHREVRLFLRVLYESEFLIVMEEFVLTTMNSLTTHLKKGYLSASM